MKRFSTILITFILSLSIHVSFAQSYCTPSYPGGADNFYTHILRMAFGEINRTYTAPLYQGQQSVYYNYTYYSTPIVKGHTYPLSITVGNGGNTQTLSVWIDFNQNTVFESSERLYTKTDNANVGDHILRTNIAIPANALLGSTRMRVGTIIGNNAPDPCVNTIANLNSQNFHDYTVQIVNPNVQSFVSASTFQATLDEVTAASINNEIIRIEVNTNTDGALSPLNLDTFYFSTLGTTNPSEIINAKLFYTGKNPEFLTTNQIGGTVSSPGTYFKVIPKQKLEPGKNYFWLTYDISSSAIIGNVIDARCNGVYVTTRRFPSVIDPTGTRSIGYCISKGNKSQFVSVRRVNIGSINTFSGYSTLGYSNYTYLSTTLYKGSFHYLSVESGNGVNTFYTRAWIDFNRNGVFDHPSEMVLHDSMMSPGVPPAYNYGPLFDSFEIPLNAPVGPTRMRVVSHYNPTNPPYRTPAVPCENPLEVGEVEDYTIIIADSGQTVAEFSSSVACLGSPTTFTEKSYTFGVNYQVSDWVWDFGDGDTSHSQNPVHTYINPGVYTVTLKAKTNSPSAIWASVKKSVKINNPVANFSWNNILYKSPITFLDETSGGIATKWYWNFGDPASGYNNLSNAKTPNHVFDTVGTYNVMLAVTTDGNCVDTVYKTIFIDSLIKPVANYSASSFNPYYQQDVLFVDQSIYFPTSWKWKISPNKFKFINNSTDTNQNVTLSFDTSGLFVVKLVVQNSKGKDSVSRFINVKNYSIPIADFTAAPTTIKAGQLVSFLDMSVNDPSSWQWLFGDGDTSFVQHPIHNYNTIGNFSVVLKASNPAGTNSKTKASYIKVTNEYTMCDNEAATSSLFSGFIFDSGGKNADYSDGSSCGFLIKPECSGPITLNLSFIDMDVNDYFQVYDGVDATGIPLFTGSGFSGTVKPGPLTARSGALYIREVTDMMPGTTAAGFGASWTAISNSAPIAKIKADTIGYVKGPITFLNNTTLGAGNSYAWDYNNDGIFEDTVTDGYYRFDSLGYYTIALKASNCKGSNTAYHTIHIVEPIAAPIADFEVINGNDTILEYEEIRFIDLSTNGPSKWKWEITSPNYYAGYYFVQGTSDTSQNPIIGFYGIGGFDISLTCYNKIGASQKVTRKKYIVTVAIANMGQWPFELDAPAGRLFDGGGELADYENNENYTLLLKPCAEKVYLKFKLFNFAAGDYLRVYDGEDNTGLPLHPGNGFTSGSMPNYNVPLVAESGKMFIEEVTTFSGVAPGFAADWYTKAIQNPTASFIPPDTAYTKGSVAIFKNTSSGLIEHYYWDYDYDGGADDSINFDGRYAYSNIKTQYVYLEVTNCSGGDAATHDFPVINPTTKPVINFEANVLRADTSDVITLTDLSVFGPNSWIWTIDPPNALPLPNYSFNDPQLKLQFNDTGTYSVTLQISNQFGSDSMTKPGYLKIFAFCQPRVNNLLPDFGISRVNLNTIDNPSKAGTSVYTDYTKTISTTLEVGGTYEYILKSPGAVQPYSRKIWIDYNQDGLFSEPEELAADTINDQTTLWTGNITVPTSALLGPTRMRISFNMTGYTNTPCGPNEWGEYEDYRIIISEDKTPPELELLGSNPAFTEIGYGYIDAGATAIDAVDGNISSQIVVTGSVDTLKEDKYLIHYNVKDSKNNVADELTRTVYVTPDRTNPVITLKGNNPFELELNNTFIDPGATAIDNWDGNLTSSIQVEHSIDNTRVDTFQVSYYVYDNTGNPGFANRAVHVMDKIPPVITLTGPDTISMPIGGTLIDPGATATDNYYTDIKVVPVNNVNATKEGWYWIRYNASDPSGNKATEVRRTVKVGNPVSVYEEYLVNSVTVFPNPAQGEFTISLELVRQEDVQIRIFNSLGKLVKNIDLRGTNSIDIPVNLSSSSAGIYFVKTHFRNKVVSTKVTLVK
ncbi:GEVED domain-containing protein [Bacteroidota bacterium]